MHGHPGDQQRTAIEFTAAACRTGRRVERVFFYHDAVQIALQTHLQPSASETQQRWIELQEKYHLELTVCVGAATRRNVIDESSDDIEQSHPAFEVVGLGQLIDAILNSDRFITFTA